MGLHKSFIRHFGPSLFDRVSRARLESAEGPGFGDFAIILFRPSSTIYFCRLDRNANGGVFTRTIGFEGTFSAPGLLDFDVFRTRLDFI